MVDFKNGKIYKVYSPSNPELVYYGSTVDKLSKRFQKHRASVKLGINISSKIIIENYDDSVIELVEEYPCDNRDQLNRREGYYILNNRCVNKQVAGRTLQEHYHDNIEDIKVYRENWYQQNKEKILENAKDKYKNDTEKLREKARQYREANREAINIKQKQKARERRALLKQQVLND